MYSKVRILIVKNVICLLFCVVLGMNISYGVAHASVNQDANKTKITSTTNQSNQTQDNASDTDSVLTKEEMYKLVIESQKDKIGLLQGNISNVIGLFSVIFAIIAISATVIGYFVRKGFVEKYDKIVKISDEMGKIHDDMKVKYQEFVNIEKKLNDEKEEVRQQVEKINEVKIRLEYIEDNLEFLENKNIAVALLTKFTEMKKQIASQIEVVESVAREFEFEKEHPLMDEFSVLKKYIEEDEIFIEKSKMEVTFYDVYLNKDEDDDDNKIYDELIDRINVYYGYNTRLNEIHKSMIEYQKELDSVLAGNN